jgi:hypothetical protein
MMTLLCGTTKLLNRKSAFARVLSFKAAIFVAWR